MVTVFATDYDDGYLKPNDTFVTEGTEQDAILDFHALKPVYTEQRPFLIEGLVGDTKCTLRKSGNEITTLYRTPKSRQGSN